jgi:hypothetical protein
MQRKNSMRAVGLKLDSSFSEMLPDQEEEIKAYSRGDHRKE